MVTISFNWVQRQILYVKFIIPIFASALARSIVRTKEPFMLFTGTLEKSLEQASVILIDDYNWYKNNKTKVEQQVKSGKRAIFLELDAGDYTLAGSEVKMRKNQ